MESGRKINLGLTPEFLFSKNFGKHSQKVVSKFYEKKAGFNVNQITYLPSDEKVCEKYINICTPMLNFAFLFSDILTREVFLSLPSFLVLPLDFSLMK